MTRTVGRVVIIRCRVVEYDDATGRALVVPTDKCVDDSESMTIPFADILKWEERQKTQAEIADAEAAE